MVPDTFSVWAHECVQNPREDRWVDAPLSELDQLTRLAAQEFQRGLGVSTEKAIECFQGMVTAQCSGCSGVISGEQVVCSQYTSGLILLGFSAVPSLSIRG